MLLKKFSVTNYRSITNATVSLGDFTVLVGKNNEGKSNLLRAIDTSMSIIASINYLKPTRNLYDWERDFPIQHQKRTRGLDSIFRLQFELNEEEKKEFKKKTRLNGNEIIDIVLKIGKTNRPKLSVPKRGSNTYNSKASQITEFISQKININYIPAVRTEDQALDILQRVIRTELRVLAFDQEYTNAIDKINDIENKLFKELSDRVSPSLSEFIPNFQSFEITANKSQGYYGPFGRSVDIQIDDGVKTSISYKGDGIKSLATLAILKDRDSKTGASIVAIEEPESHLHSGAIHTLLQVLQGLSEKNQVIITTHNPLFVQQNHIMSNIIVDSGKAKVAKNITEIRNILGILPSDNLSNARYVIVVEGEDDKIALQKILPVKSDLIKSKLDSNQLVIKPLGGASKLPSELYNLTQNLCKYVVLVDNDKAGLDAKKKAIEKNLLKESQIRIVMATGLRESEFEDCLRIDVYEESIRQEFGISNLQCKEFKNNNKKWSDRMKEVFQTNGVGWSESIESKLKLTVARSIPENISDINGILIPQKSVFLDNFISIIEEMIEK
ncbi:ATP-dependent nuclease [Streptococcus infantis]|jgi:hypothetical protein|uniref:ATP-dependent nuclease n=1 Tax=Streptococcus infantis TaxID=68892 RepID=UPI0039C0AC37